MKCDLCGGIALAKTIPGKDGKSHSGYECRSGCKNPKKPQYAYFFFARAAEEKTPDAGSTPQAAASITILKRLDQIDATLSRLEVILANPGRLHIAAGELTPDDELPF